MKRRLKRYTSLTHYIEFLRRQPSHMQHVYAAIFAGSITGLIAFFILYIDYGFWHEHYRSNDLVVVSTSTNVRENSVTPESPLEMLSRFFGEAKDKLQNVDTTGIDLLKGKETYVNTAVSQ